MYVNHQVLCKLVYDFRYRGGHNGNNNNNRTHSPTPVISKSSITVQPRHQSPRQQETPRCAERAGRAETAELLNSNNNNAVNMSSLDQPALKQVCIV